MGRKISIEQAQSIVKKYLPRTTARIEKYKNLLLNLAKKDKRKAINLLPKCLNDISNTATAELSSSKDNRNPKITALKIFALVAIVEGVLVGVIQSIIGTRYNTEKSNKILVAMLTVFIAPIVEELGRIIAARNNCLKHFTAFIVGYETVAYIGAFKNMYGIKKMLLLRIFPAGMHTINAFLMKYRKKLNLNEAQVTILATILHSLFNGVIAPLLGKKILGTNV